jgi:leucyl/phenylalanyl-tRNA---protein transferase
VSFVGRISGLEVGAPASPLPIYKESWLQCLRRWALGIAWSSKPPRTLGVPATLWMVVAHYLDHGPGKAPLPDPDKALCWPDGLAGICGELDIETLLAAYAKGLFPFARIGPLKWWAPKNRMVVFPEQVHLTKRLRRLIRTKRFTVTFDRDFEAVMRACAEPRPGRPQLTWIGPKIQEVFAAAYRAGYAHSIEVWDEEGNLAGGIYGLAVGRVFFAESMFSRQRDASKVAFATLQCHLQHWGFVMNDGKHLTGHLSQLGHVLIPRERFNAILAEACAEPGKIGPWSVDVSLNVAAWDPKGGRVAA